jgi:hypothetical protein
MIAALVALVMWVVPLATSGVETEDAISKAGAVSAVVHDDAGSMLPEAGAGSAVVHDDAGDISSGTGTTRVPGSGID